MANHWYYPDGTPAYEIPKKSGKGMKSPTIVDARELKLVPSVTTVAGIIRLNGLEVWKKNELLDSAFKVKTDGLTFEEWKAKVSDLADTASDMAINTGSEIHEAIEQYLKTGKCEGKYEAWQKTFAKSWEQQVWADQPVLTEQYIPTHLGFGGRTDITVPTDRMVADLKTQNTKGKPFNFYRSWGRQLVAYKEALGYERMFSIAVDSQDPERIEWFEWTDHEELLNEFLATKLLWLSENKLYT